MEQQRVTLQEELTSLRDQIKALEEALETKPEYGMGKGDPAITQWELDQAMLKRLQQKAGELEQALVRLEDGTYGICERCGQRINPNRLAVLPDTTICVACAQAGKSTQKKDYG
ncbi:MAG: TraR/DksA C4-type zinc finger protein [Anaerolineae bacterium]|nr:TraR/DksA C4-type zinc finger protein [Anaerolineae bacterium]